MQINPVTLLYRGTFKQLESEYQIVYFQQSIRHLRFAMLLCILLYSLFAFLDALLIDSDKILKIIWQIRFFIVVPWLIIYLFLTYTKSFRHIWQGMSCATMIVSGWGIIWMILITPSPANYSYYAGLILVIMFLFTFMRVRFIWATLCGLFILLSYEFVAIILIKTPISILISNNFFFISAIIIGMFACYSMELHSRRDFYLIKTTQEKEKEITNINQVVQTVNSTLEIDKTMESVNIALKSILDFNQISIHLINPDNKTLEASKLYGEKLSLEVRMKFENFPLSLEWDDVAFVKTVTEGIPYYASSITPDVLENFSERDRKMFSWNPYLSILICPLEVHKKTIGCITFLHTKTPFILETGVINRIVRYVSQVATAINNAKNHEQMQYSNNVISSLLKASASMHQKSDLNDIVKFTIQQLRQLFTNLSFGLVLHGGRPEMIECAEFEGISDYDQKQLLQNPAKLLAKDAETWIANLMKHDHGLNSRKGEFNDLPQWFLLPMKGDGCKVKGNLIVKGTQLNQQAIDIISLFLDHVSSISENKLLTNELEKLANTDGMTNTYNRYYFDKELERTLKKVDRFPNMCLSIMMIDVNGLKQINDNFGHEYGDAMIKKVADLLLGEARETDIVSRLGGDEFVVLLPNTNYKAANSYLVRIRDKEKDTVLTCLNPGGKEELIPIRVSIGLASSEDTLPGEVLKTADTRMYADKNAYYENHKRYR